MWILKENNEKATGGKNSFSEDISIEKTQFAVMVSYNANCRFVFSFFTFPVDLICCIPFGELLSNENVCKKLNFNFHPTHKKSKSSCSDSASCKSSMRSHLICLYHESQKQLEAIYGI